MVLRMIKKNQQLPMISPTRNLDRWFQWAASLECRFSSEDIRTRSRATGHQGWRRTSPEQTCSHRRKPNAHGEYLSRPGDERPISLKGHLEQSNSLPGWTNVPSDPAGNLDSGGKCI
ncbi:unnamed protein product [Cuscuta epithymum]|uniref:Uncharacterized protein n=1 Tax=Cuscuta epithymum TaxID=186058 RepID=A0AAV0EW24_9ASTE|nr:unnamed protein product [Cuscuta epithymum]